MPIPHERKQLHESEYNSHQARKFSERDPTFKLRSTQFPGGGEKNFQGGSSRHLRPLVMGLIQVKAKWLQPRIPS